MNFQELIARLESLDKPAFEDNPGMGPYTGKEPWRGYDKKDYAVQHLTDPTVNQSNSGKQGPALAYGVAQGLEKDAAMAAKANLRTQGDVRKVDAATAKQQDWEKALETAGGTSSGSVAAQPMEIDPKLDECGMDMMPMGAPKQQDSVSMNLSMNGSGAGGIRDLLDILKSLDGEGGEESDLGDIINKMDSDHEGHKDVIIGSEIEEFNNSPDTTKNPDPQYAPMNRMTATGDDLSSKGAEAPKVNGGGNPLQEQLASRLATMYEEVKARYTN